MTSVSCHCRFHFRFSIVCLANKWNPSPSLMPTQSQSIWQHGVWERKRQNNRASEWESGRRRELENESSAEWKPKRLSSCLTYITCRNYSGIFGSWPLKLPALIVNEARPPLILLTLPPTLHPPLSLCLPCHKSIRVKFFGQSIKSITKSAIFS